MVGKNGGKYQSIFPYILVSLTYCPSDCLIGGKRVEKKQSEKNGIKNSRKKMVGKNWWGKMVGKKWWGKMVRK